MPWGIDLNPFDDEDEDEKPKRPKVPRSRSHDVPIPRSRRAAVLKKGKENRRRIKKAREREKREKVPDPPGFFETIGLARKEIASYPAVIGTIINETGEAGYRDIRNALPGRDPFPYAMERDPKTGRLRVARYKSGKPIKTGGHLAESLFGLTDVVLTESARSAKDIALVAAADDWTIAALRKYDEDFAQKVERKAKEAETRLAQAPVGNLAGIFGAASIGSKAITVPAMARKMKDANPDKDVPMGGWRSAAAKELRRPGWAATQGIKGGLPPRYIENAEGEMTVGRPWSRTPGGRAGQTIYDEITRQIDRVNPNAPFAASKRSAAASRRRETQLDRGELAALTPHIEQVVDLLEGTESRRNVKGKVRQAFGIKRPIRERAEALIAALEGPQDATIREAVEARIASLEDTLSKSAKLTPQYNRVRVLRAKLKRGVTDDAERAALATELRTITDELDLALGRRVAPVQGSPERRRALREWTKRFGKKKASALIVVSDAIARTNSPDNPKAWYAQNLAEVTSEDAQKFIDRIDPIAAQYQTAPGKRMALRDPGQRSVVGQAGDAMELLSPSEAKDALSYLNRYPDTALVYRMPDGAFRVMERFPTQAGDSGSVYRIGTVDPNEFGLAGEVDWEWGMRTPSEARKELRGSEQIMAGEVAQTRTMAKHLQGEIVEEPPVFYSQLQRQIDEMFSGKTQRMKAQSLQKRLKASISDVEWDAMGLEDFFDRYAPTDRITEKELQDYLSDPLNAYNLDEYLFSSAERNHHFRDRWGWSYNWRLVHKEAKGDEVYYELIMAMGDRMPGQVQDFRTMHWSGIDNPIVHIRFMVITDNTGKRAIVIDEIQSDWASDVRKRKERDRLHPIPGVEELERMLADLHDEAAELRRQHPRLDDLEDLKDDYDNAVRARADAAREYNNALDNATDVTQDVLKAVLADRSRWLTQTRTRLDEARAEIPKEVLKRVNEGRHEEARLNTRLHEARRTAAKPDWKLRESHIDAALRRMMRFAHDDDIDRIIIAPPELQVMRNASLRETPSGERIPNPHDPNIDVSEWTRLWQQFRGMDPDALRRFIAERAGTEENRAYFQMYGKDFPNKLAKHIGHDGRFVPGVMNARFADEAGLVEAPEAPMGAWVIDLGSEGRRRASIPMRQMQQQPEWDALPRGATELLADGRQAMRLFEGADVDTVIHELAHIAMPDMDADTRAIIEGHFGGKYEDWTTGQSEAFARAFEQYMRTGRAANVHLASAFSQLAKWMREVWAKLYRGREDEFDLHPELAAGFDRMLGYQGTPTILSKVERSQVRNQIKALTDALDLPLDSDEYKHAAATLEAISEQIEAAGEAILTRHADPSLTEAIKEGLARRRDIVTERMAGQGVLPNEWTPETRARGYFPQTSIWDIQGMPQTSPVRMQAVQDVVGAPRLESKTVMRKPNRLIRYSTGEVLNDPAVLVRVLRSRMRYLNTLDARNELWDSGKPIKRGEEIPKGVALIRNPNKTPKKIADDIYAALRLPPERYAELEMRGKMDEIDEADDLKEAVEDFIWVPEMGAKPHWVSDDVNVRAVPLQVARTRLGDVFTSGSRNVPAAIAGTANAMARLAAIYLPFAGARYVTRNAAQNAVMLAMTQPSALARIGRRHSKYKADHPEDYARILAEGGTILGTALPEFNTRPKGLAQGIEQKITERTGAAGSYLGKFADNPFRWASWTRHAESYGYDTPAKYHELLTDEKLRDVRETVMQQTRDDMIDFDALTPWEKEVVSRYMFLWPFIRGITKWPFMYAREYPLRVAAIGAASRGIEEEEDPLGTGAIRERLIRGGRDFGWLDPSGPMQENWERMVRIKEGRTEVKLSAIADMLAPHFREIIQSLSDRQGVTWKKALANTYVPFASTVNAINRGGSPIDQLDRFLGQSTEPPISIVTQRKKRADEINHYLDLAEEQGLTVPEEPLGKLLTAHKAYEKYKELSARVQFGLRDQGKQPSVGKDSKNHRLRAAMLLAIADEFYPGSMKFSLEDYDSLTQEGRDKFFSEVEKGLWGIRQDFLREAKEQFGKEEAA